MKGILVNFSKFTKPGQMNQEEMNNVTDPMSDPKEQEKFKNYVINKVRLDILNRLSPVQANFTFTVMKFLLKDKIPDIDNVYQKLNYDIIDKAAAMIKDDIGSEGIPTMFGDVNVMDVVDEAVVSIKKIVDDSMDQGSLEEYLNKIRNGIDWSKKG